MQDTAGEVGMSSLGMYSYGPLHMTEQKQGDQFEPTYSSSENTGCSSEDLPKGINDWEGWREKVRDILADDMI